MLDEFYVLPSFAFNLGLEKLFKEVEIFDNRIDLIAVESERLFELVEDANKVDDETMRLYEFLLFAFIGPVHPRNRLQQRVVAHGLVEIHRVEDRRVETSQQLLRDDEDP